MLNSLYKKKESGFTLIELLVTLSIIGMLSSIILPSLNSARGKSYKAKVQIDTNQLSKAILLMASDVEVWPNGCVEDVVYGPGEGGANEITLDAVQAGLLFRPTVGVTNATDNCEWTTKSVNAWNGPYIKSNFLDPWGRPYWFDQDYHPLQDCPTTGANPVPPIAAIVSIGPDGIPLLNGSTNTYNCDDMFYQMK